MGMYSSLISASERETLATLTASAVELNYLDITTLGTAEASKALTVASTKGLVWTTTSAVTWNPFQMTNTMTQAGNTGGRMLIEMTSAVVLGGWAQAIKAHTNFTGGGGVTGLGSALNAEMTIGTAVAGKYAPLEMELNFPTNAVVGSGTSFMWMNVSGDDLATFNNDGFLFEMGTGITAGAGDLFQAETKSGIAKTHTLKVRINGTIYYLALHTSAAFGGS